MESQPQNPEFRSNPENFHLCVVVYKGQVQSPHRATRSYVTK